MKLKYTRKYNNNTTPLSIDISPHRGENERCKARGLDGTFEAYSTLAPLMRGALDRVRGKETETNYFFYFNLKKMCQKGSPLWGGRMGSNICKFKLILLFITILGLSTSACRFTVREIGFSILSQDIYTLAVIDGSANPNDVFWQSYHLQNKDCNIRLEILHPEKDSQHPVVIAAKEKRLSFPATVLVSPDRRVFVFEGKDFTKIYSKVKDSFLRTQMRKQYPDVFAFVFWVPGKDNGKNRHFEIKIQHECDAIENIMPSMPKIVKHGPVAVTVSADDFEKENLLLWSLGIEEQPDEPQAFVLYGRGRIMGEALNYEQVMAGGLYKYMSMIGADCECGLDRKWMLGHQIPLYWPAETRQHLAKLVGFDVDNPMILAEMSRILAKEKLSDASGSVAFAPETIDLYEVFGSSAPKVKVEESAQKENKTGKALIFTLIGIVVFVLAGAAIVLFKKK